MFNYLSQKVSKGQHRGGGGKDKVVLTSFPEPGAHDTFLTMQRQYGLNVYEDAQLLAVLKKKYGVTIYKEDAPPLADEQKKHSVGDKHDSLKKNRDRKMYWMDDTYCNACYKCGVTFTLVVRKHHCRICGQIFCGNCSLDLIKGEFFGYANKAVRCCESCNMESHSFLAGARSSNRRRGVSGQSVSLAIASVVRDAVEAAAAEKQGGEGEKESKSPVSDRSSVGTAEDVFDDRNLDRRESRLGKSPSPSFDKPDGEDDPSPIDREIPDAMRARAVSRPRTFVRSSSVVARPQNSRENHMERMQTLLSRPKPQPPPQPPSETAPNPPPPKGPTSINQTLGLMGILDSESNDARSTPPPRGNNVGDKQHSSDISDPNDGGDGEADKHKADHGGDDTESLNKQDASFSYKRRIMPENQDVRNHLAVKNSGVSWNEFTKQLGKPTSLLPLVMGWMYKQGQLNTAFKTRFFVLDRTNLFYYRQQKTFLSRSKPQGKIDLDDVDIVDHVSDIKILANHPFAILLSGHERNWTLVPASASAMNQWLYALRRFLDLKRLPAEADAGDNDFDQEYYSTDGSASDGSENAEQETTLLASTVAENIEANRVSLKRKMSRRSSQTDLTNIFPEINLITIQEESKPSAMGYDAATSPPKETKAGQKEPDKRLGKTICPEQRMENNIQNVTVDAEESKAAFQNLRRAERARLRNFLKSALEKESSVQNDVDDWLAATETLVQSAIDTVQPRNDRGDWLSILPYVKVKTVVGGGIGDSSYVDGLVFRKMLAHRGMSAQIGSPRIVLLGGGLIFQPKSLTSFETLGYNKDTKTWQEDHYMALQVQKIADLRPTVVIVSGPVSRKAMEMLLEKRISVLHNVKASILDRAARMLGAVVVPSVAQLDTLPTEEIVGNCATFEVVRASHHDATRGATGITRSRKKQPCYVFLRGCPRATGCSLLLRGADKPTLKCVKKIVIRALHYAFDWRLTSSLLHDMHIKETALANTAPLCPGGIMFSETTIKNQKQESPASLKSVRCYDIRDQSLLHYLEHAFSRSKKLHKKRSARNLAQDSRGGNAEEIYFFRGTGRLRVSILPSDSVCQPSSVVRMHDPEANMYEVANANDPIAAMDSNSFPAAPVRREGSIRALGRLKADPKLEQNKQPDDPSVLRGYNSIRTWGYCIKCKKVVTPCVVLSDPSLSLTFGSYLHKMFSPDYFSCREKSCGHDAVRSIVRYFGKRNNVICIKYNKIRVYEAIQPSKPVADDRAVRLYHDVLCKSLEQEAQRTFSAFDKFCIAKIELCNVKNVSFEPMSDDGGNPVLWEDIRARLLELKDEINSCEVKIMSSIRNIMEEADNYGETFPLFSIRKQLFTLCKTWNNEFQSLFVDVKALIESAENEARRTSREKLSEGDSDSEGSDSSDEGAGGQNLGRTAEGSPQQGANAAVAPAGSGSTSLPAGERVEEQTVPGEEGLMDPEQTKGAVSSASPKEPLSPQHQAKKRPAGGPTKKFGNLLNELAEQGGPTVTQVIGNAVKMFTGTSEEKATNRVFEDDYQVQIEETLFNGNPDLPPGIHGIFVPVAEELPSSVIAHSLASLDGSNTLNKIIHRILHAPEANAIVASRSNSMRRSSGSDVSQLDMLFVDNGINASALDAPGAHSTVGENDAPARRSGESNPNVLGEQAPPGSATPSARTNDDHPAMRTPSERYYVLNERPPLLETELQTILLSTPEVDDTDESKSNVTHRFLNSATGCKFEVTSYFAAQFYALRLIYLGHGAEGSFVQSLAQSRPWRTSGGKSSAHFNKTLDDKFVVKCVSSEEFYMFHQICKYYFHFMYMTAVPEGGDVPAYPSSLVKILGMYRVKVRTNPAPTGTVDVKYVVVMQNLFCGMDTSNLIMFDLKGKTSRYFPKRTMKGVVQLDGDLLRMTNSLPLPMSRLSKNYLGESLFNDTLFLQNGKIIDYSLIIGIDTKQRKITMGVIDYMHSYDIKKKIESTVKSVVMESTIKPPGVYCDRFMAGIDKYFCAVPQDTTAPGKMLGKSKRRSSLLSIGSYDGRSNSLDALLPYKPSSTPPPITVENRGEAEGVVIRRKSFEEASDGSPQR